MKVSGELMGEQKVHAFVAARKSRVLRAEQIMLFALDLIQKCHLKGSLKVLTPARSKQVL